jgi:hypothetical protein
MEMSARSVDCEVLLSGIPTTTRQGIWKLIGVDSRPKNSYSDKERPTRVAMRRIILVERRNTRMSWEGQPDGPAASTAHKVKLTVPRS